MKKTLITFFTELKKWLVSDYKILLLSLIIACICFPEYALTYSPGIDGPLPWVFNYFANDNFLLGKDVLFPHGPLAFLLYPLPLGNNLVVAALITFFCSVLLSISIFKIHLQNKEQNYLLPFLLSFLIESVADIQLLIVALSLCYLLQFWFHSKKAYLILSIFFCVFNLFVKNLWWCYLRINDRFNGCI